MSLLYQTSPRTQRLDTLRVATMFELIASELSNVVWNCRVIAAQIILLGRVTSVNKTMKGS